jgi:hypothetical protein
LTKCHAVEIHDIRLTGIRVRQCGRRLCPAQNRINEEGHTVVVRALSKGVFQNYKVGRANYKSGRRVNRIGRRSELESESIISGRTILL